MHNYRSNPDIIGANALLPLMNEGVRSVGQSGPWAMEYDQQDPFDIPKYWTQLLLGIVYKLSDDGYDGSWFTKETSHDQFHYIRYADKV